MNIDKRHSLPAEREGDRKKKRGREIDTVVRRKVNQYLPDGAATLSWNIPRQRDRRGETNSGEKMHEKKSARNEKGVNNTEGAERNRIGNSKVQAIGKEYV